jgi:microcystin-dependent protein
MTAALLSTGVRFPDSTVQRRAFPSGGVIMWYGNVASVPTGWYLCDGANGTPDMRDKFVVCAGGAYAVGDVGGEDAVTLTAPQLAPHTHGVDSETIDSAGAHTHPASSSTTPTHTHPFSPSVITLSGPTGFGAGPAYFGATSSTGPANLHSHTSPDTSPAGDHTHPVTVTVNPVGAGDAHENRPPHYALAYLMKA